MRKLFFLTIWILISFRISICQNEQIKPIWFITRGGPQVDEAWGVDVDSAGNIYWGTHQTKDDPLGDIYLYKLNPEGTIIWEARWGGQFAEQTYIVRVKEPYVYVGGSSWNGLALADVDLAIICFSTTDGSLVWDFTWNQGFGYDETDGLVIEDDGIYAAGWTTGENTQNDIVVLKLNLLGEMLWFKTWGSDVWDEANGHIVVHNDKIFVAGRYNAPGVLASGFTGLAAFDKLTGNYLWDREWKSSTGWPPNGYALGKEGGLAGI